MIFGYNNYCIEQSMPRINAKYIPGLLFLLSGPPGCRIVSHSWDMKGVIPDPGYPIEVRKKDGYRRVVYRWTTPLRFEKESEDGKR